MSHCALSSNHFATCPKQIILQNAAEAIVDGRSAIVMSYMELRKTVKSLGIKGMEVHHLIEKRFAKTLGIDPDDIPSILLLREITRPLPKHFGIKSDISVKSTNS